MAFKVILNGANYVSEERRRAFERALADASRTRVRHKQQVAPSTSRTEGAVVMDPGEESLLSPSREEESVVVMHTLSGLERALEYAFSHQTETLRVHQQYLTNEAAFTNIVGQVLKEQARMIMDGNAPNSVIEARRQVAESVSKSLVQFHDHHAQTLTVHEQFLQQQASYVQSYMGLLHEYYGGRGGANHQIVADVDGNEHGNGHHPSERPRLQSAVPVMARESARSDGGEPGNGAGRSDGDGAPARDAPLTPAAASPFTQAATQGVDSESMVSKLLQIVSDKTGYPVDMLELDMDMEADLGIDSIKRVEILGALQEVYPDLPDVPTDQLAELRTLEEIVQYMRNQGAGSDQDAVVLATDSASGIAPREGETAQQTTQTTAGEGDGSDLAQALLAIVSDKTGYPADMLELDMDMEADLGIDSIKRVEILGALQERYPDLPEVDTEVLGELRTLEQVLETVKRGILAKKV